MSAEVNETPTERTIMLNNIRYIAKAEGPGSTAGPG